MKVLQQPTFCVCGSIFSVFAAFYLRKMGGMFELRYSKADREGSRGLAVENFSVLFPTQLFSRNNGFPAFFLLLHPPLFEVESQRQEQ